MSPLQKAVLLAAAAVLLFVVLCPATPTPTAVVKKQILVGLLLVAASALLWKPTQMVAFIVERGAPAVESGRSIRDLTCVRLC